MTKLYYGFLDESGILEKKAGSGNYFIVAVVLVGNPTELQRAMKHARQKARRRFKIHSVFKASKENSGFIKLVLLELAKRDIGIVIGAWDKQRDNFRGDKNELYAHLLAETTSATLALYPKLNLTVHKRYTSPRLQELITRRMSAAVGSGNFLAITHRSETECRQLELADAVAWVVFQKYNQKKSLLYDIIKPLVKRENRLIA